jgi:alpha-galactosidase
MYLLDATHPAALSFLRETFTRVRAWGFRYLKLDFLYGGAYEGRRHNFRATGMEALRMGLQAIGKAANPDGRRDTYLLACGAPILPVVGLFHANRTGGDTGAPTVTAEGRAGTPHLPFDWIRGVARNVASRWYHDRALYTVDPDVVMVTWPQLSEDEARVLVALCALSGGSFLLSDDLPASTPGPPWSGFSIGATAPSAGCGPASSSPGGLERSRRLISGREIPAVARWARRGHGSPSSCARTRYVCLKWS